MNRFRRLIPLLVLLAFLGIAGGTSVFAHGAHHTRHHPKNPPVTGSVVPTYPGPTCFATQGATPLSRNVSCLNLAATTRFTLTINPDCSSLVVTTSAGATLEQTPTEGGWDLISDTSGRLSFSVDGTDCPRGTYTLTIAHPGIVMSFFQATF